MLLVVLVAEDKHEAQRELPILAAAAVALVDM